MHQLRQQSAASYQSFQIIAQAAERTISSRHAFQDHRCGAEKGRSCGSCAKTERPASVNRRFSEVFAAPVRGFGKCQGKLLSKLLLQAWIEDLR